MLWNKISNPSFFDFIPLFLTTVDVLFRDTEISEALSIFVISLERDPNCTVI